MAEDPFRGRAQVVRTELILNSLTGLLLRSMMPGWKTHWLPKNYVES